jgi:hypothetical protein
MSDCNDNLTHKAYILRPLIQVALTIIFVLVEPENH